MKALLFLLLGCTAPFVPPLSNRGGTPAYMAPEQTRSNREFACSAFRYGFVHLGGCWWVR